MVFPITKLEEFPEPTAWDIMNFNKPGPRKNKGTTNKKRRYRFKNKYRHIG